MEPCLLLLLRGEARHGYDLARALAEFDMKGVDGSVVYRLLRNMEQIGLIASRWQSAGSGPARRMYQLTALGSTYLADCVHQLQETDRALHRFLERYDRHMSEDGREFH